MKKTLSLVIFALLFATGSVMSQKQLYFGAAGTIMSTSIVNQNNYGLSEMDYVVTTHGAGNINVGFDFNNHLGLKLEFGTSTLGQKYKDSRAQDPREEPLLETNANQTYDRDVKLNYFQLPILFKFRSKGAVAKFYFLIGPQFNFLMSAKQTYTKNGSSFMCMVPNTASPSVDFNVTDEDIKVRYVSMDIMGRLDLGVDIIIVKHLDINVGLTMAYGFTDINATDYRTPNKDKSYGASHNLYGGLNVGLSYILPMGSK